MSQMNSWIKKTLFLVLVLGLVSTGFDFTIAPVGAQETPLTVSWSNPVHNATIVSINTRVIVAFSDYIKPGSTFAGISLRSGGKVVNVTRNIVNDKVVLTPANHLAYNTSYTVTVPVGAVQSLSGASLQAAFTRTFTTEPALIIWIFRPQFNQTNVPLNATISLWFGGQVNGEIAAPGPKYDTISVKDEKNVSLPINKSIDSDMMYIHLNGTLVPSTTYTVSIPKYSMQTILGTVLETSYTWKFTTEGALAALAMNPAPQAQNVSVNESAIVYFNRQVIPGANYNSISVKDSNNRSLKLSKKITYNTLILDPTQPLSPATTYTVTVPQGGVSDVYGIPYKATYSARFTTAGPLKVVAISPTANQSNVSVSRLAILYFNHYIMPGTNYTKIALTSSNGTAVKVRTSVSSNALVIAPVSALRYNTAYTVTIPRNAVTDEYGAAHSTAYSMKFKTRLIHLTEPLLMVGSVPLTKQSAIPLNSRVTVYFNHYIMPGTNYTKIALTSSNGTAVKVRTSVSSNALVIAPVSALRYNTAYTVTIPRNAVTGTDGSHLAGNQAVIFSTLQIPLHFNNMVPAANARAIPVTSDVTLFFGQDIRQGVNYGAISLVEAPTGKAVAVKKSIYNNMLVIAPVSALRYNTVYTVTVPRNAVESFYGAQLEQAQTANFGTQVGLVLTNADMWNNFHHMPLTNYSITLNFNKLLTPSENYAGITLKDPSKASTPVAVKQAWDRLLITPLTPLRYNTTYTLAVPWNSVHDAYGGPLDKNYSISFSTEAQLTLASTPPNNKTNVPITSAIILSVNTDTTGLLQGPNFQRITVKAEDGRLVNVTITLVNNFLVVIKPVDNLNYNTNYTVVVPQGAIKDGEGSVCDNFSFKFTTVTPLMIYGTSPGADATGVLPTTNVTVSFSRNVQPSGNFSAITLKDATGASVAITTSVSAGTLTIHPVSRLAGNTMFTVFVPAGAVQDVYGNVVATALSFKFTTVTPLMIYGTSPGADATGVLPTTNVTVSFSRNVQPSGNFSAITLKDATGASVAITTSVSAGTLTIHPVSRLAGNTMFTVFVPAGAVQDVYGNVVASDYTTKFTTQSS